MTVNGDVYRLRKGSRMARDEWAYDAVMTEFWNAIETYKGQSKMARQDYDAKRDARKGTPSKRSRQADAREGVADWTSANPTLVVQAIAIVAFHGGALRFGYTRDGGAYAIGILGDGDPYTEYVKPSENLDDYLGGLIERWRD